MFFGNSSRISGHLLSITVLQRKGRSKSTFPRRGWGQIVILMRIFALKNKQYAKVFTNMKSLVYPIKICVGNHRNKIVDSPELQSAEFLIYLIMSNPLTLPYIADIRIFNKRTLPQKTKHLTLYCIMPQNGQTHFKNLAINA